jgi:Protein of unknown function (DUF2442)
MNSIEQARERLPRVQSVSAAKAPWTLDVVWADGGKSRVDLTGLIHRSKHFRAFLDDPAGFRKVGVTEWGSGVEWENGLDYSADTLKVMADEQRPVTGSDLRAFETENHLSTAETAKMLGLAERTVRNYRGAAELPHAVAIALRALGASNTVLIAHYLPAGQSKVGRPKRVVVGPKSVSVDTFRPILGTAPKKQVFKKAAARHGRLKVAAKRGKRG